MTEKELTQLKQLIDRAKSYFPRELVENATDYEFLECILSGVIIKGEELKSRKQKIRFIDILLFVAFCIFTISLIVILEKLRGI